MQGHIFRAYRERDWSLPCAPAGQIEIERTEPNQSALAALLDEFGRDQIGVADKVRDETAHGLFI